MRARAATAVIALLLVAACSGSEPADTKPTFGGGPVPTVAADELAAAKAQAGIDACPAPAEQATGDEALPGITLECLGGGNAVDVSTLAGRPTVINIFASWCRPCRDEMPLLARADAEYGDAVQFVGIDFGDAAPDDAIELARASGVTYPLLADPDQITRAGLKVAAMPQTLFVDAQGRIVATERTPYDSYADLTAAIRRHLGVTP
ncbi:TlpA family protein disulfide reductase [Aeromicrobium fastidiosum]|uniref:TlpA family protein disulfide reductase n=1 Tax=Aeromicrobium fastidiosum TaxID=52699 RepID=A0A641AV64_9ACTN|nr:TlpA disulfide reductase family protein [Aeromicrobium fastidiosum]KAA1380728.1 TlpA family protein disulfide reductase [Aeromicrobium fastidiosum]MBP2390345.1 thiol-disulfide isomerase/thioredoxin [Aeromicrobium fastidiosum]